MSEPKDKQYPLNHLDSEGCLVALRAAAQEKGSPLSDAEREAIYESVFKK